MSNMKKVFYPFEFCGPITSSVFFPSEYIYLICFVNCNGFLENSQINHHEIMLVPAGKRLSFQIKEGKIIGFAFSKEFEFMAPNIQNPEYSYIFKNRELQMADVSDNLIRMLENFILMINDKTEELSIPDLALIFNAICHSIFFRDHPPGTAKADVVSQAINLIHQNYASSVTLKDISDSLFINPSYLSYAFHQRTGITFSNYLLNVRLAAAKEQLLSTNELISTISLTSGFSSSAYFISCFRKKYGMTPYKFRKSH